MKKRIAMLLALLMLLSSLTACGSLPSHVGDVLGSSGTDQANGEGSREDGGEGYAVDGYAEGFLGETMHTYWFDFTIDSAYTCTEFDGLTPDEGYKFLVAEITLHNTTRSTQPMYFWDFQLQWDAQPGEDEDQAFGYPLYEEIQNEDGESDFISVSDLQLPTFYDLGINETRTGTLLYMVPEGAKDYSISFQEIFEDDTEGDLFFIWFNAEEK